VVAERNNLNERGLEISLFILIWWCFKKYAEKNNMAFDKIEV
jgi:hypothetical protein